MHFRTGNWGIPPKFFRLRREKYLKNFKFTQNFKFTFSDFGRASECDDAIQNLTFLKPYGFRLKSGTDLILKRSKMRFMLTNCHPAPKI